jgi:hypothetical protein
MYGHGMQPLVHSGRTKHRLDLTENNAAHGIVCIFSGIGGAENDVHRAGAPPMFWTLWLIKQLKIKKSKGS